MMHVRRLAGLEAYCWLFGVLGLVASLGGSRAYVQSKGKQSKGNPEKSSSLPRMLTRSLGSDGNISRGDGRWRPVVLTR